MRRWISNLLSRLTGSPQRSRDVYEREAPKYRGNFYEVRTVHVALVRLDPDSPDQCPISLDMIVEHVETEEMELKQPPSMRFLRTALIGKTRYWIWTYNDNEGDPNYAVAAHWPDGNTITHCDGTFDMTPEQYILATHFEIEASAPLTL